MNTVRDILLARHRHLENRLDRLRRGVFADAFTRPGRRLPWWVTGWRELIVPVRTAWTVLAGLALLAVGLNLSAPRPGREVRGLRAATATTLAEVRRERERLLVDLRGAGVEAGGSTPAPRDPKPRNRSALPRSFWPV